MALPTETITLLKNAKLIGPLDCNGQLLSNADPDSFPAGTGPGGGNDTGITTAILKGDGHHGFADAVPGTDYATPAAVAAKEDTSAHNSDISTINGQISAINTSLTGKADTSAVTTALAAKEDTTSHNTDISTINGQISTINTSLSGKADTSAVTTALGAKADTSALTSGLATKENTLPTTANDAYILARHNPGGGGAFFYVDPVTLGSTSGTYTDGSTHSNTTFNSPAQAVFTVNDNGKTIVSAGNIPSSTTITFVNATTVTLSNAATTTASPITFTIINRFLAAGGGGTVTNVAVTNTAVADLVTTSVNNPSTSAEVVLSKPASTAGKTFYGNSSALAGTAAFMNQTSAFAALDISTAGKSIAQIVNPTAISYPRINADNSATARTPAQVLGDIGAESALTFNTPLARGTGPTVNTISIPAATDNAAGHLTASDHTAFAAKLSGSRTITTTSPLLIDGVASKDLSNDRTISMPAAAGGANPPTTATSGYLTATDWTTFNNKVPPTRTLTTTAPLTISNNAIPTPVQVSGQAMDLNSNRVLAVNQANANTDGYISKEDFALLSASATRTYNVGLVSSGTVTPGGSAGAPFTRIVLTTALTGAMTITMPPANLYTSTAGFPFLELVDLVPGGAMVNFGITFNVTTGIANTIDNQPSYVVSKGSAYQRFNSNGATKWFSTTYFVNAFVDPATPTNKVLVSLASTLGGIKTLTISDNSVTINPVISDIPPTVLYRSRYVAGVTGSGNLVFDTPIPDPSNAEGKTLVVQAGIPTWGDTSSPWTLLTPGAGSVPWAPISGQRIQNGYVTLNQNATLVISPTNLSSGMEFNLLLTQDTPTGGRILTPPPGTYVGGNGLGVIPQNTSPGVKEWHRFNYTGGAGGTSWLHALMATNMTTSAVTTCGTSGTTGGAAAGGFPSLGVGATSSNMFIANTFVATESAVCKIDANLYKFTNSPSTPSFTVTAAIYTDVPRNAAAFTNGTTNTGNTNLQVTGAAFVLFDVGQRITVSAGFAATDYFIASVADSNNVTIALTRGGAAVVATSSVTTATVNIYGRPGVMVGGPSTNTLAATGLPLYADPTAATAAGFPGAPNADQTPTSFTGVTATLTPGTTYYVVLAASSAGDNQNNARWLYSASAAGATGYYMLIKSAAGTWGINNTGARKMRFTLYHAP